MPIALVCGAGIAGLSTALHLKRDGWTVRLFEKEPELRTAGVGLNIWPNGVRVLANLGFGDEYLALAASVSRWWTLDSDGSLTSDTDVSGWTDDLRAPLTGARRRELNAMLASGLGDELIFGRRAVGYRQTDREVTLLFDDGRTATGDVLIAADGIWSRLRNQMLGGPPQMTDEGVVRWRGVFACADARVPTDVQADVYGPTGHIGWIPIDATHAYWYGSLEGCAELPELIAACADWTSTPIPAIIRASAPESLIGRPIAHYASHLSSWTDGQAVLVGDAAHPMYPGMAQGANQALIDGRALAEKLTRIGDVATALRAFETERMPTTDLMVEYSRVHFDAPATRIAYRGGHNGQIARYLEFEGPATPAGLPR